MKFGAERLLHVLQGGEVFLAGADLDHAGHIVDEDLAVADVAGVKSCLLYTSDAADEL